MSSKTNLLSDCCAKCKDFDDIDGALFSRISSDKPLTNQKRLHSVNTNTENTDKLQNLVIEDVCTIVPSDLEDSDDETDGKDKKLKGTTHVDSTLFNRINSTIKPSLKGICHPEIKSSKSLTQFYVPNDLDEINTVSSTRKENVVSEVIVFNQDKKIEVINKTMSLPAIGSSYYTVSCNILPDVNSSEKLTEKPLTIDDVKPDQVLLDPNKIDQKKGNIKGRLLKVLIFPILSLIVYVADIGTDINMALSYKKENDINEFWITVGCIVIPSIIMAVVDVSLVWFDKDGAKCVRYLVGAFSFGRIYRGILYMYHMYLSKVERDDEKAQYHREKARDEKRDCFMLDFIGAFAESVPQLFVQLYLFYSRELDLSFGRGWALSSSLVSIAWTYSAYYRSNKEAIVRQQDVSLFGFLFFFLSVVASLLARVICIVLFLVYFKFWIGIYGLIGHFAVMFIWITFLQKPSLEGLTTKMFVRVLYYLFFAYVNMLCFTNLVDSHTRWRMIIFYGILYVENIVMAILVCQKPGRDNTVMLCVLLLGLLCHIVFLWNYYRFLHPKTGLCYNCK